MRMRMSMGMMRCGTSHQEALDADQAGLEVGQGPHGQETHQELLLALAPQLHRARLRVEGQRLETRVAPQVQAGHRVAPRHALRLQTGDVQDA